MTKADTGVTGLVQRGPGDTRTVDIGWPRAILSALAILAAGILGCVYLPDLIVTGFDSLSADTRADLAAVVCLVVLLALAWCLRRLQGRGLI